MPSGYEGGRREKLADFVGITPTNSSKTRRPDTVTFDYLTAFCPGPVANADTTEGVVSYAWRCRVENPTVIDTTGKVYISRRNDTGDDWGAETELFTFTGEDIKEVDIAFTQNARPTVCASRDTGTDGATEIWLYWFDSTDSMFGFDNFGAGRTPRVILDAPFNITDSDVLLFYLSDDALVYRQQQDRYDTEIDTPFAVDDSYYIEDVVKLRDSRIRVDLSHRNTTTGKYSYETITSTLYPILAGPDNATASVVFISAELVLVVIVVDLTDVDSFDPSISFLSATNLEPVIVETLSDIDSFDASISFISAELESLVIEIALDEMPEFDPSISFTSAEVDLIVIEHELFDRAEFDTSISFTSATVETV